MENLIGVLIVILFFECAFLFIILLHYCGFNENTDTVISYKQFTKLKNRINLDNSDKNIGLYGDRGTCFIKVQDDENKTYIGFKTIVDFLKYQHFIANYEEYKEIAKREAKKQKADQLIQSLLEDKEKPHE